MGLRERIGTLFRIFLLFTVLVAVALISFITTVRFTIQGHQETAPNFVGMTVEKAQQTAGALGLELKVEDKLFSTQYPANQIVSQMPPQGTGIKMGQHIHVLVSLGKPQVTVPNVVGTTVRAAQITAIQRGLTVGDVAAVHWSGTEADQVVGQDPRPEAADVRTPSVNLLVSLGVAPPAFLCPSFIGRPLVEARGNLEKAGFKIAKVTSIPTGTAAKGVIISQSPPPGSKIGSDAVFDFQVTE